MDRPARPPEADLLRNARTRQRLSLREAAARASSAMPPGGKGISEARLRQIEAGYQTASRGVQVPTAATAATLAYLARFYGITPDELESEGKRPDAAEILRDISRRQEPAASSAPGAPAPEDEALRAIAEDERLPADVRAALVGLALAMRARRGGAARRA